MQARRMVLQVEDDPRDAELLRASIRDTGVAIDLHCVASTQAALGRLERAGAAGLPDLILLDLHLPGPGGLSLLTELLNEDRWRLVPVAVLSASERPTDLDQARELGAVRYVRKPAQYQGWLDLAHLVAALAGDPAAGQELRGRSRLTGSDRG